MRIGELAKLTRSPVETIRYYESVGILPPPMRGDNNYRDYSNVHLRRLGFVRRCRELGFSLAEVRNLLTMIDGSHYSCDEVQEAAAAHLADVRVRLEDLRRLEASLSELVSRCSGGKNSDCAFLEALFESDARV